MSHGHRVGIVGGGQLAVMMADAADDLGLEITSLAQSADDPIFSFGRQAFVGDALALEDLRRLAGQSEVLTFDHELVDYRVLAQLESEGVLVRPGSAAMAIATNKERQYELFERLEIAQPDTVVVSNLDSAFEAISRFDGVAVLKTAKGGYDGRGVLLDSSEAAVREWFPATQTTVLVQRRVDVEIEIAAQVVRAQDGAMVTYAPVRTIQSDGMCSIVHIPADIAPSLEDEAMKIARVIAEAIDVVGILAVEFFVLDGELLVNELAARPHNSGHLTIEASATSQFENHLRAVTGLPLKPTDRIVPAAAMANIVGQTRKQPQDQPFSPDVFVHMYGKTPRPGRKLGHVTATAETTGQAIKLALDTANELEQESEM
ncbi:MAG: 5-(carboxyamino)imidazole ribonucleotide synthase [Acidimicrobiales bacterium]